MTCLGKADYQPADESMGERQHLIGEVSNPLIICKKKEVPKLFNERFWFLYEIWKYFHYGFGLPDGKPWDSQEPELMRSVLNMEAYFKQHFSIESVNLKYQEAILKNLSGVKK